MAEHDDGTPIFIHSREYSYQFSKGLLAHDLEIRGLALDESYRIAVTMENQLLKQNITDITEDELMQKVKHVAFPQMTPEDVLHFKLIDEWKSKFAPLVILLAGARGTGSASIGRDLANRLAIQQIVSTSTISQILRKMIAEDMAPELHAKSYAAYKRLRPLSSILHDKVIMGFEEHSRFTAQAIEAIANRAIIENISLIIRGEHILSRFISRNLMSNPNVLFITLEIKDADLHKKKYLQMYPKSQQKERKRLFIPIRQIHDYLTEQARNRGTIIINAEDKARTTKMIYQLALGRLATMFPDVSNETEVELAQ